MKCYTLALRYSGWRSGGEFEESPPPGKNLVLLNYMDDSNSRETVPVLPQPLLFSTDDTYLRPMFPIRYCNIIDIPPSIHLRAPIHVTQPRMLENELTVLCWSKKRQIQSCLPSNVPTPKDEVNLILKTLEDVSIFQFNPNTTDLIFRRLTTFTKH
jgi:hypothetical protein